MKGFFSLTVIGAFAVAAAGTIQPAPVGTSGGGPAALSLEIEMTVSAFHPEGWVGLHADSANANPTLCGACHTQADCSTCHRPDFDGPDGAGRTVAWAAAIDYLREAGEAATPPLSHAGGFRENHGNDAAANPSACASCHVREQCLECHLPSAGTSRGFYHPLNFLSQHPAESYNRSTSCADCHNTRSFCVDCHSTVGLAGQTAAAGFHDAKRLFSVGHGPAARQNLESCVSCHTESDCLTCHSAQTGQSINPHGPSFDAARLREANPELCSACHGTNIP